MSTNIYNPAGLVTLSYGSRDYPVGYGYDYAGRLKQMTNWSSFNRTTQVGTQPRVTAWDYHPQRGWLAKKRYPDKATGAEGTNGPEYTYTSAGRLKTRKWLRNGSDSQRILTTYTCGFEDTATWGIVSSAFR